MLTITIILCLLPIALNARLTINVKYVNDNHYSHEVNGNTTNIISDVEKQMFRMTEDNLRTGVEALAGSRPDLVFLRDPIPGHGDVFANNRWEQTMSVITVNELFFNNITFSKNVVIDRRFYTNPLNVSIPRVVSLESEMGNRLWIEPGDLCSWNVNRFIDFNISFQNRRSFSFTIEWGCRRNETISTRIANVITQTIPPRGLLTVVLSARLLQFDFTATYKTGLRGQAVGYWRNGHLGQTFRAFDIETVMRFGGMPITAFSGSTFQIEDVAEPELTTNTF